MDTLLGTTLDGYTLKRLLGSGGMGAVYLAEDPSIGQQVAIKVVRTDDSNYSDSLSLEQATERFRQEARAVASLDHLNILPLYRYGEEETASGDRAYIVMQYRPEGSLLDWLRRRAGHVNSSSQLLTPQPPEGLPGTWPLGVAETAVYLRQAASALQYAHDRGIIHRDVKPANFLLRFDLNNANKVSLLLSDFGLAKFYAVTSATSHVFGTPIYMAPEQFDGTASPESDQYALAIMSYYLLAGRPPFEGDPMHLMLQHLRTAPPSICTLVPTLPASIESVLNRALAKQPGQRYPSIMTFAEAFTNAMHGASRTFVGPFTLPTIPAVNRSSLTTRSNLQPFRASTSLPPTPQEAQAATQTPSSDPYEFSTRIQAPQNLAFQPPTEAQQHTSVQTKTSMPLSGSLASPQQQALYQPPLQIPASEQQTSRRNALGWILGGAALLAVGTGTGVYIATRHTPHGPPPIANAADLHPNISNSNIQYILHGHSREVTSVAWSPDGNHLASCSVDDTVRVWNVEQRQYQVYSGHSQPVLRVAWSLDSRLLASGGKDKTIRIWDNTGTSSAATFSVGAVVSDLAWQQASTRLFAATIGNGIQEIFLPQNIVISTMPKTIKRATATSLDKRFLAVDNEARTIAISPDGRFLAVGNETGMMRLYTLPTLRRILELHLHKGPVLSLAWSPDSAQLASGGFDKMVQIMETSTFHILQTLPLNGTVSGIAWSPDNAGRLATIANDGNLYTWSIGDSRSTTYRSREGFPTSLAWAAPGLVTGMSNGTIIVWNL